MWRYLKYFVPLFILTLIGVVVYLIETDSKSKISNSTAFIITLTPVFIAFWYLYFTKRDHKYTVFLLLSLVLAASPFLLRALDLIEPKVINDLFWGKSIGLWCFSLGSSLASGFYVFRFYQKPEQDVFSLIKLLLVLLATILLLVNMLFIEDEKIYIFSTVTVLIVLVALAIVHITDMIIWERKNHKEKSNLHSLDNMIEEISGK